MQDGVGQFVPEGVADFGGIESAASSVAAHAYLYEPAGEEHLLWTAPPARPSSCSNDGKRQMPNRLGRGPHTDLDVVTKTIQALHQLALGQIGEVTTHHP